MTITESNSKKIGERKRKLFREMGDAMYSICKVEECVK